LWSLSREIHNAWGTTHNEGYNARSWQRPSAALENAKRRAGKLPYALQNFSAPIRPIKDPTAIRLGMQAGPSQMPVFPSTGIDANLASLAAMTNGSLGMGA